MLKHILIRVKLGRGFFRSDDPGVRIRRDGRKGVPSSLEADHYTHVLYWIDEVILAITFVAMMTRR